HLAGENIGAGRWTRARKQRIFASRVDGTRLVAEALASLARPPHVFLSISAVGIYGTRDAGVFDESGAPADDFLASVCAAWESAADAARARGIRVVHPRFGVVLSPTGGVLARLRLPFSLGLGGPVGGGRQPTSWV